MSESFHMRMRRKDADALLAAWASRDNVWILGRWVELSTGANWEIIAAFSTREEAITAGREDAWVARLPIGVRAPEEMEVFPEAEYIANIKESSDV